MKKFLMISVLFVCVSCASGSSYMKGKDLENVSVGMTVKELEATRGQPYDVKELTSGEVEYEYIERVSANQLNIRERHYFFLVKDGKVVDKKVKEVMPPPMNFRNSFDLQTSSNESEQK